MKLLGQFQTSLFFARRKAQTKPKPTNKITNEQKTTKATIFCA